MKRFVPYILIGVIVISAVLMPFGVSNVRAANVDGDVQGPNIPPPANQADIQGPNLPTASNPTGAPNGSETKKLEGGCSLWNFDMERCAATATYNLLVRPTSGILYLSGQFLNYTVNYSLTDELFKNTGTVSIGWKITRDIANMFFIFILLYIAIATILQLSGYGMKDLLVKIIIIALLINFSLIISQTIIKASNLLAFEFYNKIGVADSTGVRDISAIFVSGFNPQNLFKTDGFDKWIDQTGGDMIVVFTMFVIAAIINIIASFVLLAAGVMFVMRIAVLWLLMILGPLAFLAMVLPKTQTHANQWWDKLFNQAIFAPAFLFMFYLVAKIIDNGFLENLGQQLVMSGENAFFGSIVIVLINFTVIIILMTSSLVIATQLGAAGSATAMGYANSAKGWGQGKIKGATIGAAGVVAGTLAGRAANLASKGMEGEGRIAGAFRSVPFLQRGTARASEEYKQKISAKAKEYSSYSDTTLKQLHSSSLTKETKAAIESVQRERAEKENKKIDEKTAKKKKEEERVRILAAAENKQTPVMARIAAAHRALDEDEEAEQEAKTKAEEEAKKKADEEAKARSGGTV